MMKNIKIVILAAGSGKRLKMNIPKAMVELDKGFTILDWQLGQLSRFFSLDNILLVVGYKKELLMERYHYLQFVYNRDFDITNTSKSLLLGLKKLPGNDVLWLNGDVVFAARIMEKAAAQLTDNFIAVNRADVGPEEVKYQVDSGNNVISVSKDLTAAQGEAVGINFIKKEYLTDFIAELEAVRDQDYFEKALENLIRKKSVRFQALDIGRSFCVEVDFRQYLSRAIKFMSKTKTER